LKILLRWDTAIGARVLVAEGGDAQTAKSIAEAHRALGLDAHVLDDEGRYDMRKHFQRLKAEQARANTKAQAAALVEAGVTILRKRAKP
tara:strand:+ start:1955 stop:2221 length:267 start_codon:yes stop_codon:yes gene_type:complete